MFEQKTEATRKAESVQQLPLLSTNCRVLLTAVLSLGLSSKFNAQERQAPLMSHRLANANMMKAPKKYVMMKTSKCSDGGGTSARGVGNKWTWVGSKEGWTRS